MLKKIVFIALAVVSGLNLTGQTSSDGKDQTENQLNAIKTAVPFLTIAPDSKAGAMGDAGVATSTDNNSQHWNLAKYPFQKEKAGVSLSYTPWLRSLQVNDLNLLYLAGYMKFDDKQALSGAIRYFNLGDITEVTEDGTITGNQISPNEFAIDLGYSRLFSEYIGGGVAFRYIRSDIANGTSGLGTSSASAEYYPGNSFAADIAGYYQREVRVGDYDGEMAYGLSITNIGNKMTYSDDDESQFIPTNLRLGGRLGIDIDNYNKIGFTMDLNKLLVPTPDTAVDMQSIGVIEGMIQSFYDAPGGFSEEMHEIMWSIGADYWYMEQFAIRLGYFHEHETKGNRKYFTAGVGLNLNVFSLDFSYLFPTQGGRTNPLANTMRFTLGFRFE